MSFRRRPAAGSAALSALTVLLVGCGAGSSPGPGASLLPTRTQAPSNPAGLPTLPTAEPTRTAARPPASTAPPAAGGATPTAPVHATSAVAVAPPPAPAASPTTAATTTTSTTGSTPWGWVIGALVVVAAVALSVWLVLRRRRRRQWQAWQRAAAGAAGSAHVAEDLLPRSGRDIIDLTHWESVRAHVDEAAGGLDRVATGAPTREAAAAVRDTAQSLRELTFVLDSERLLQAGTPMPSAAQLAEADATAMTRRNQLDVALAHLDLMLQPAGAAAAGDPAASTDRLSPP